MPAMTTDQAIALVTGLGTVSLALLGLFSLREAAKQRRASFRPQLALKKQSIYAGDLTKIDAWLVQDPNVGGPPEPNAIRYTVRLFNIGLGAAKDVRIHWTFPVDVLCETITTLAAKNKSSCKATRKGNTVDVKPTSGSGAMFFLEADSNQKADFILPHREGEGIIVDVPATFGGLVSMYIHEAFQHATDRTLSFDDALLTATLDIQFSDIGGQRYSQQFAAKVIVAALRAASDTSSPRFYGFLDFSSKHPSAWLVARAQDFFSRGLPNG